LVPYTVLSQAVKLIKKVQKEYKITVEMLMEDTNLKTKMEEHEFGEMFAMLQLNP